MGKKVVLDTNILMADIDLSQYETVYIPLTVCEELDKHKESSDNDKAYKGRRAIRNIQASNNIEFVKDFSYSLPKWLDTDRNDNRILGYVMELQTKNPDVIFVTGDLNLYHKAKAMDLICEWYEVNYKYDMGNYNGWNEVSGNTECINQFYQDVYDRKIKFLTNEYLIIHNTDTDETTEERFDGEKFVALSLPPSKSVKGLNPQQRCALDLLHNKDIPVKIIVGKHGSGKTMLATKVALHHIEKETYKTLVFLRNPVSSDGTEIGYLPGSKEEKTIDFMRPLLQYIENEKTQGYADFLIKNEKVKMDVVTFLKGVNIDDSFVIVDEAEDLNTKLIKLVGSRIAKKSCIVFTGDYKQAESRYKSDNGLLKLISEAKGHPLVGIVNLPEDLRSEASKIFSDL
jgi:PhoH-like ATPase